MNGRYYTLRLFDPARNVNEALSVYRENVNVFVLRLLILSFYNLVNMHDLTSE